LSQDQSTSYAYALCAVHICMAMDGMHASLQSTQFCVKLQINLPFSELLYLMCRQLPSNSNLSDKETCDRRRQFLESNRLLSCDLCHFIIFFALYLVSWLWSLIG